MAFLRSITRSRSLFSAVQKLRSRPDSPSLGHIPRLQEFQRRSITISSLFSSKIDSDPDKVDVGAVEEGHRARCELTDLEEESLVSQENRQAEEVSKNIDEDYDDDSGNQSQAPSKRSKTPAVRRPLPPEMAMLVSHLYEEGYFKDVNFVEKEEFDITCFEHSYAWNYIKCAVVQFGRDKQEIAKLLPAEDLKKVALFGCPSVVKKGVHSAKFLRRLYRIPEDTVCMKCALRESCHFECQELWACDRVKKLKLHHAMRVITLYALGPVPEELTVPAEIKESVNRLLQEVVNLSKTLSVKSESDRAGIPTTSN